MSGLLISGIGGSPKAADDSTTCRAVRICAPGRFLRGNEESVERRSLGRRGLCRVWEKEWNRFSRRRRVVVVVVMVAERQAKMERQSGPRQREREGNKHFVR